MRSDGLKRMAIIAIVSGTAAIRIAASDEEMYRSPTGISVKGMAISMTAKARTICQRSRMPRNAPTLQAIGSSTAAPSATRAQATNTGEWSSTATLMRKYGMPHSTEHGGEGDPGAAGHCRHAPSARAAAPRILLMGSKRR